MEVRLNPVRKSCSLATPEMHRSEPASSVSGRSKERHVGIEIDAVPSQKAQTRPLPHAKASKTMARLVLSYSRPIPSTASLSSIAAASSDDESSSSKEISSSPTPYRRPIGARQAVSREQTRKPSGRTSLKTALGAARTRFLRDERHRDNAPRPTV
uniref:Uncharacterized protein n=1 Tax=Mycena chlorophos TaxID=658473 RepID=A0ABQ0L3P8_MYCCL|nr:predicted protein [Mycena chlorophos]